MNARSRFAGRLPPLVLMTDDRRLADPLAAASALPRGSMVVVRSRDAAVRRTLASSMMTVARARGLVVVIAADPDLARDIGADGLHLPEARAAEATHWRARLPSMIITSSVHGAEAMRRAQLQPIEALFLSPIFPTQSHQGAAALSPARAGLIARVSRIPVYALGGVHARNAGRLIGTSFAGIAAIGALSV